ncbi:MAG: collagen-like protein [Acidobacteriia bacterium]|nr:collagen-like protein [Terriglobia bacterium]
MNRETLIRLDGFCLGGIAFCLSLLLLILLCSCQEIPGPQGPAGPQGPKGESGTVYVLPDTAAIRAIVQADLAQFKESFTVQMLTLQHKIDSAMQVTHTDTVWTGSDSVTAPLGLFKNYTKLITADTCTIYFHQRWIRENGVPLDSIGWRVQLIDTNGNWVRKWDIEPTTQKDVIAYLLHDIPMGQSIIGVRARDTGWHWSKHYYSTADDFVINRVERMP